MAEPPSTTAAGAGRDLSGPAATRIMLRPIATPFPLGMAALGTASLLVAGLELGWFTTADRTLVAVVLVGFCFPLQLLASIFGFLGRDTSAATGFGIQGGTWLVVGIQLLIGTPGHVSHAVGVLLLVSSAWVLLSATGATLGKLVPGAVLFTTALRFLLTGLYELTASHGLEHAAAIVGLALVLLAGYAALALEIENSQRRTVLPLLRRGAGASAMVDDLAGQAVGIAHEAGVREQL